VGPQTARKAESPTAMPAAGRARVLCRSSRMRFKRADPSPMPRHLKQQGDVGGRVDAVQACRVVPSPVPHAAAHPLGGSCTPRPGGPPTGRSRARGVMVYPPLSPAAAKERACSRSRARGGGIELHHRGGVPAEPRPSPARQAAACGGPPDRQAGTENRPVAAPAKPPPAHSSLRWSVSPTKAESGAGPMASTVREPAREGIEGGRASCSLEKFEGRWPAPCESLRAEARNSLTHGCRAAARVYSPCERLRTAPGSSFSAAVYSADPHELAAAPTPRARAGHSPPRGRRARPISHRGPRRPLAEERAGPLAQNVADLEAKWSSGALALREFEIQIVGERLQ
jgi:hypothetical protein